MPAIWKGPMDKDGLVGKALHWHFWDLFLSVTGFPHNHRLEDLVPLTAMTKLPMACILHTLALEIRV